MALSSEMSLVEGSHGSARRRSLAKRERSRRSEQRPGGASAGRSSSRCSDAKNVGLEAGGIKRASIRYWLYAQHRTNNRFHLFMYVHVRAHR
jgi:hypothetical protein